MRAWQPRGMNANILLDCPYRKFNAADRQAQRLQASNQRSLGSRASRRPSPRILNDKTARKMASPGQTAIQGALVRKRWAVLSMEPHDGAGGCWPSPKKDRLASAMMAGAIEKGTRTISARRVFGRVCFWGSRTGGVPEARPA